MIKVNNPKPLSEIEELRQKGLYNAPYSVLEAVELGGFKVQDFDDSDIQQRLDDLEMEQSEFVVTAYEEIARVEEKQDAAIVELYEVILGGNLDD